MDKKMFLFTLSFFSMTLFSAEKWLEKSAISLKIKRNLSEKWQYNSVKRQATEEQSSSIFQNQDDDEEMVDVEHFQELIDEKIYQFALELQKKRVSSPLADTFMEKIELANQSIAVSKNDIKKLLKECNSRLFVEDEIYLKNGNNIIKLSRKLRKYESKEVSDKLKKLEEKISSRQLEKEKYLDIVESFLKVHCYLSYIE